MMVRVFAILGFAAAVGLADEPTQKKEPWVYKTEETKSFLIEYFEYSDGRRFARRTPKSKLWKSIVRTQLGPRIFLNLVESQRVTKTVLPNRLGKKSKKPSNNLVAAKDIQQKRTQSRTPNDSLIEYSRRAEPTGILANSHSYYSGLWVKETGVSEIPFKDRIQTLDFEKLSLDQRIAHAQVGNLSKDEVFDWTVQRIPSPFDLTWERALDLGRLDSDRAHQYLVGIVKNRDANWKILHRVRAAAGLRKLYTIFDVGQAESIGATSIFLDELSGSHKNSGIEAPSHHDEITFRVSTATELSLYQDPLAERKALETLIEVYQEVRENKNLREAPLSAIASIMASASSETVAKQAYDFLVTTNDDLIYPYFDFKEYRGYYRKHFVAKGSSALEVLSNANLGYQGINSNEIDYAIDLIKVSSSRTLDKTELANLLLFSLDNEITSVVREILLHLVKYYGKNPGDPFETIVRSWLQKFPYDHVLNQNSNAIRIISNDLQTYLVSILTHRLHPKLAWKTASNVIDDLFSFGGKRLKHFDHASKAIEENLAYQMKNSVLKTLPKKVFSDAVRLILINQKHAPRLLWNIRKVLEEKGVDEIEISFLKSLVTIYKKANGMSPETREDLEAVFVLLLEDLNTSQFKESDIRGLLESILLIGESIQQKKPRDTTEVLILKIRSVQFNLDSSLGRLGETNHSYPEAKTSKKQFNSPFRNQKRTTSRSQSTPLDLKARGSKTQGGR